MQKGVSGRCARLFPKGILVMQTGSSLESISSFCLAFASYQRRTPPRFRFSRLSRLQNSPRDLVALATASRGGSTDSTTSRDHNQISLSGRSTDNCTQTVNTFRLAYPLHTRMQYHMKAALRTPGRLRSHKCSNTSHLRRAITPRT